MVGEPEDRRTRGARVTPDPLEHPDSVVERVVQNVDLRIREVDEGAVHPDLLALRGHHLRPLRRRVRSDGE